MFNPRCAKGNSRLPKSKGLLERVGYIPALRPERRGFSNHPRLYYHHTLYYLLSITFVGVVYPRLFGSHAGCCTQGWPSATQCMTSTMMLLTCSMTCPHRILSSSTIRADVIACNPSCDTATDSDAVTGVDMDDAGQC